MTARHTTTWEEQGQAGIDCEGHAVDLVLDSEAIKPQQCPQCKRYLRLKWIVEVLEIDLIDTHGREAP